MARSAVIAGVALLLAGGGVLGYALTRKPVAGVSAEASGAMARAVSQLDGAITAERGAIRERAQTFSQLLQVRAAIETNPETARDMVERGELAFKPVAGEVIELIQTTGATPVTLTVQPADAPRAPADAPRAELAGDRIVIRESAPVERTAGGPGGQLRITRPLDLAPRIADLVAAGVRGRFELGGEARAIGEPVAGAREQVMPLPSEQGARLVVAMAAPAMAGAPRSVIGAGAAAGAVGLVLIVLGAIAGRREPSAPTTSTLPGIGGATTIASQLGVGGVAAGTPSPVGGGVGGGGAFNPSAIGAGAQIGRWEVVRRLGSGGMADVFLAHAKGEAGFEKLVAIKVMHSHLARNQRAVDHFLDEARLAARIHHPNVVGIQDLGKIGDDYVIVMDYVEGVDLERLLANARDAGRQVPLDVALGILVRICDGLSAAHHAPGADGAPLGLIHRDVKSANVLVSRQGGVKVVDFGIAKAASQVHQTVAGETKGTPAMMAPEQRVGEAVDVRVDVYAVAAVGYEVITGQAINLDLATLAHLGVDNWPHLPPPTSLRADAPIELDKLLLGAMSFERERRPADCAALGALFEAVAKRHGLAATDKDIARWVDGELRVMVPAFEGVPRSTRPVA